MLNCFIISFNVKLRYHFLYITCTVQQTHPNNGTMWCIRTKFNWSDFQSK